MRFEPGFPGRAGIDLTVWPNRNYSHSKQGCSCSVVFKRLEPSEVVRICLNIVMLISLGSLVLSVYKGSGTIGIAIKHAKVVQKNIVYSSQSPCGDLWTPPALDCHLFYAAILVTQSVNACLSTSGLAAS